MLPTPRQLLLVLMLSILISSTSAAGDFALVSGGTFDSVMPETESDYSVDVADFWMQESPVTNAEFLRFAMHNPRWQKGSVASVFVDSEYLSTWAGAIALGAVARANQPVTQVSWFAANAYCESVGARLPSWYEWEYVAAADENRGDARREAAWRQEVLSWYSHVGGEALPDVAAGKPNFYGISDMHGLVWEWVDDFNALLVSGDNREQGGADELQFCGAGAMTMDQKENYAILMRVAMMSALEARYTTRNLGFRCARSAGDGS